MLGFDGKKWIEADSAITLSFLGKEILLPSGTSVVQVWPNNSQYALKNLARAWYYRALKVVLPSYLPEKYDQSEPYVYMNGRSGAGLDDLPGELYIKLSILLKIYRGGKNLLQSLLSKALRYFQIGGGVPC